MYPSGGNNAYVSQPYGAHQAYGQMTGTPGTSLPSQRVPGLYGSSQQTETGLYHGNIPGGPGASAATVQYGGQYGAYTTSAAHQGLSGSSYASSPTRGQYGQSHGSFSGRDLLSESGRMYSDHIGLGRSHQSEPDDQISFFRQQHLMHTQKQPPSADMRQSLVDSYDGSVRASAADYLAARGAAIRRDPQDYATRDPLVSSYGLRNDVDTGTQGSHPLPSLGLRIAMGRSLEDDSYARGSSATNYGVTLPPGRDYSSGKVLGNTPSDASYRGSTLSRKEERGSAHYKLDREEEIRRDRERDRERERLVERREREREREQAKAHEIRRRDRTPPRITRAPPKRRTGSLPLRRSPPRSHRHSSPVKERRKGYACKVTPYCLVEAERDLSSISRRYPRLSISNEFSKLVIRWPKGDLDISFSTPVTFEHDYVELSAEGESKVIATKTIDKAVESGSTVPTTTVWNAKVVLMSGMSTDALAHLRSEKSSDRPIHMNGVLKFALLREGRVFSAIGGSWDAEMDGGDPSSGDSSLIPTAIRCTRELVQVDLANCLKWNPFLEIHYDRVSKDGLHNYKEITLLFLPDLENCLPSIDAWCGQWMSKREARLERDRDAKSKKEKKDKNSEKKDDAKGTASGAESMKSSKGTDKLKKKKDDNKVKKENEVDSMDPEEEVVSKSAGAVTKSEKVDQVEKGAVSADPKVDSITTCTEKLKKRVREDVPVKSQENADTSATVKKGKVGVKVKKVKTVKKQAASVVTETSTPTKPVKKATKAVKKKTAEKDVGGEVDNQLGAKETPPKEKTVIKKKVKKVIKKEPEKATAVEEKTGATAGKQTEKKDLKQSKPKEVLPKEVKKASAVETDGGKGKKDVKQGESLQKCEGDKTDGQKDADMKDGKPDTGPKSIKEKVTAEGATTVKDEGKSSIVKKDKGKSEEPPQFPGLFLQAKRSKGSNVRSTTLSLDGLLDYNENDVEESTFELSLFAEALHEMLQFKMGCRILSFLEKLHESHVKKRLQRKRDRPEDSEMDREHEESSKKRPKVSTMPMENDSAKLKTSESDDEKSLVGVSKAEDDKPMAEDDQQKESEQDEQDEDEEEMEDSEEEDPEEEPLEDEDEDVNGGDSDGNLGEEQSGDEKMDEKIDSTVQKDKAEGKEEAPVDEKPGAVMKDESAKQHVVDKELLQAFCFFDREWVGYIKLEDLRTIIYNLGKFHSKRAVKELLRIALQESTKDHDGRINYMKLLKAVF